MRGYRRFRCRTFGRQFNERSAGVLNRTCLPSDIIAFVVSCRLRYKDLSALAPAFWSSAWGAWRIRRTA